MTELKDLKILHLIKTMDVGGAEKITLNLCRYFSDKAGTIKVLSSGGTFLPELKKTDIEHILFREKLSRSISSLLKARSEIIKQLKKEKIDIIHCHHRIFFPILYSMRLGKTKVIYTAHNVFNDFFQKMLLPDYAAAVSPTVLQNLRSTMSIAGSKISKINYGVRRSVKPGPNGVVTFGYVGRFVKGKGIFRLLEAVKFLRKSTNNFKLIIRGSGGEEGTIINFINKNSLQEVVKLEKPEINDELIYAGLDAMVLPTKINEGLPVSILECLANEIVVISTLSAGIKDVLRDGETGFVLKSDEPEEIAAVLKYVVENFNSLSKIKEKGSKLVTRDYSEEAMYKGYEKLYLKAVNS